MSDAHTKQRKSPSVLASRRWSGWLTFAVVVFGVAVGYMLLPTPLSTDLSVIGQGRPAAVLVFNKEGAQSTNLMDAMGRIRGEYQDRMHLLVADVASPKGRRFANEQQVSAGTLVLLGPQGERLATASDIRSTAHLRKTLEQTFDLAGP